MSDNLIELLKIAAELAAVTAERDTLAARLAPVEDEKLVEIGIGEIERGNEKQWHFAPIEAKNDLYNRMRAAIAAIRPHIEAAEREQCAKIAEGKYEKLEPASQKSKDYKNGRLAAAAAIRSGK